MFKKHLSISDVIILVTIAVVAVVGVALTFAFRTSEKSSLYDIQVDAANRMKACMNEVKDQKSELGIAISPEDKFETGMIGEDFNFITSTRGDITSKRTSANPDMAALLVVMFDKLGLKEGDTLGCNFSGSFPSLNIATLCACDSMGIKPVYIASTLASTWGANNPELSFPEMVDNLYKKGLVAECPVLITPGGGNDVGEVYDEEQFAKIWDRVIKLGYPTMIKHDFAANVNVRYAIFEEAQIDAFIAVGGNVTSLGKNMIVDVIGEGIIRKSIPSVNENSGLIEKYLYESKPTIMLLNLKQIVADYGMTYDPVSIGEIGDGSIYYEYHYNTLISIISVAVSAFLLIFYKLKHKKS